MVQLPEIHPGIYKEFMNGNFVVQRSHHKFSLMAKDQSHEHCNKALQQSGGGLADMYDNAESIMLYMLAAPETARIIQEFENSIEMKKIHLMHTMKNLLNFKSSSSLMSEN